MSGDVSKSETGLVGTAGIGASRPHSFPECFAFDRLRLNPEVGGQSLIAARGQARRLHEGGLAPGAAAAGQ